MRFSFTARLFEWRGPSPYHFLRLPDEQADEVAAVKQALTYGWGVIPATVTIGATTFTTSLFPKDGGYLVPVKDAVRRGEALADRPGGKQ